jgi:hypothetical protein
LGETNVALVLSLFSLAVRGIDLGRTGQLVRHADECSGAGVRTIPPATRPGRSGARNETLGGRDPDPATGSLRRNPGSGLADASFCHARDGTGKAILIFSQDTLASNT